MLLNTRAHLVGAGGGDCVVVDEGLHTVTGGSPTELITLASVLEDMGKYAVDTTSVGQKAGAGIGIAWRLYSTSQIELRAIAGNLVAGNRFYYRVRKVPGEVERGSTFFNITNAWGEDEITLINSISASRARFRMTHQGQYVSYDGSDYGMGYLKPHATDSGKLVCGNIGTGGAVMTIYYEVETL